MPDAPVAGTGGGSAAGDVHDHVADRAVTEHEHPERPPPVLAELDRAHEHAQRLEERLNGVATLDARLRELERHAGLSPQEEG